MPESPKIAVIAASTNAFSRWREEAGVSGNFVWNVENVSNVTAMRSRQWYISNILCLPGWETRHRAQEILAGLQALLVSASERASQEQAPSEPEATVAALVRLDFDSREACVQYIVARFPELTVEMLHSAPTTQLIDFRRRHIEWLALSNQVGRESECRTHEVWLNERVARIRGAYQTRQDVQSAMTRPVPDQSIVSRTVRVAAPVADVLRDIMTGAREETATAVRRRINRGSSPF